jgi:hypothetical protein
MLTIGDDPDCTSLRKIKSAKVIKKGIYGKNIEHYAS